MQATLSLPEIRRALWISLGACCVTLGLVGVVVPGLPTTVFLLIASWSFARGSQRLHDWLHRQPRLAAYLAMARGGMPKRALYLSLGGLWIGSFVAWLGMSEQPPLPRILLLLAALGGSAAIVLCARRRPAHW